MPVRFIFAGREVSVPCSRNLNLLAHAQLEELDVGSRCGGFGECGGDAIKVLSGASVLSPVNETEREHLSTEESREWIQARVSGISAIG